MTAEGPRTIALLVNPQAGRGRAAAAAAIGGARLRAGGADVRELVCRTRREAAEIPAEIVRRGVDAVVVAGGDGSVHLAVQALAGTAVPLGILPAGTGNDAARTLGLPMDPTAAADVVMRGHCRVVDLALAGTRRYFGVLAAGFDARVNDRANGARYGRRRYELAVLGELRTFAAASYVLDLDGSEQGMEAVVVAVGNAPTYGGGMRICAGARVDDGLLDVVVVSKMTRLQLARVFPRIYTGSHLSHPAVTRHRVRRVTVSGPDLLAYADGEPLARLPVTVRVEPGALRVLVPGNAPVRP